MPANTAQLSAAKRALLAKRLRGERKPRAIIPQRPSKTSAPLSFSQQRLWFLTQLEPNHPFYNIPTALRLEGDLDIDAFQQALNQMVDRHEILRTTFATVDEQPQQIIHPHLNNDFKGVALAPPAPQLWGESTARWDCFPIEQINLSKLSQAGQEQEIERLAILDGAKAFDLSKGPLLRVTLIGLSAAESVLLFTLHHIISDAWSTGIFVRELALLYTSALQSKPVALPPLPMQYADFAHWQRHQTKRLETQLDYWRQQFETLPPVLALATDRPRPAQQTYQGDCCTIELPEPLTAALEQLAQETDCTLFMVLLASFQVLLHRYTHQSDITVGTPIANRNQIEIEGLIGFFLNTLALRADLSGNPTFKELLEQVRERTLGAYGHQDLPFEKLIDELDVLRNLSHSPLFQVMLILQNVPTTSLTVPGLTLTPLRYDTHTTKFDLTLICIEQNNGLTALMEFSTDLYSSATIKRMLAHWHTLLEGIVEHPQANLSDLPLLTPFDLEQRQKWNQTQTRYPLDQPLHVWIEQQVDRTPDAIATSLASLEENGTQKSLTYRELDTRANQLAHTLKERGIGPDILVGVFLERSLDLVVALLGILKAGGAYVSLDPDYPAERIAYMVADAQPALVLTQETLRSRLPENVPCLPLEQDQIATQPQTHLHSSVHSANLAYVIYTSGSTGKPKGAMNTHAAICNRLLWMQETFALDATDHVLQKTPFSFDVSVWEFFWPLMTGAKLVVAKPGGHRDSTYLINCIKAEQISTIHFVPAMLSAFLETPDVEQCSCLKTVIASGEALPVALQEKLQQHLPAQLHNLYGPTEAAIDVSHWHCQASDQQLSIPLGYPIANIQLHVLDQFLHPVPIGVPGELHIGGIGLARGYLNRPGLTAEKFIPDPYCDQSGARLYKTGDLVRYLPTGVLEFLGRIDHQVKIRGLRIELGEIEATLQQHPQIKEVAVKVHTAPSGAKQLVAYGVLERELKIAELQKWLAPKLPDYMVPGIFVPLLQLPLSPNGKIDRRALVPPHFESDKREQQPPQTTAEQLLADIWSQLLNVSSIGIDDNFFELGGDSILSLQVVSRATQAGLQLTPKQLFQHQTIRSLAQVAGTVPVIKAEQAVAGNSSLLPIQHWFFEQALPNPDHWNQAVLLKVPSSLTFVELQRCVERLVQHHDGLRSQFSPTQFSPTQSHWTQTIPESTNEILCQEISLTSLPPEQQSLAITETAAQVQSSLNITVGPLLQIALFRTAPQEADRLLITIHHLVVDGISWRILLDDFQALLKQQNLPPKTCSARQWNQQLKGYDALAQKDFWLQQGVEATPLPIDFSDGSNTYATRRTHEIQLSTAETTTLLQRVPKAYSATINDLLVAALVRAITQWSKQPTLRIDFEGHGRADLGIDISRTVGWFTTLYPVQFDLSDAAELSTALKTIKEQLRQVPDQGLGYGVLRYLARDAELQSQAPAPIRFNYLGQFELGTDALFSVAPESMGPLKGLDNPCTHALTVDAEITAGQLTLRFGYSQAQYRAATIETMAMSFCGELRSQLSHCLDPNNCGFTPSDFPLAPIQQRQLDHLITAKGKIADLYPLSPAQQGILFHTLYAPNSGLYITQFSYKLKGNLNVNALQQAWQAVIDQHPALRTAFVWEGLDQPLQYVEPQVSLPWTTIDLVPSDASSRDDQNPPILGDLGFDMSSAERGQRSNIASQQHSLEQSLGKILYDDRVEGFALDQAPLMRVQLVRLSEDTHELIWSFHHLILDGWSLPLVLQTVFQHYGALEKSQSFAALTPCPYRDYIHWLSKQDQDQATQFWRQYLQGFSSPTSLGGKTNPILGSRADREQGYTCLEYVVSEEVSITLQEFSQRHRLTTNTLAQGAWGILLSHISAQQDVVFGATTAGRPPELVGAEQMVGVFINTLPVRIQIEPELEILSWLMALQQQQITVRQYEYSSLTQVQQLTAVSKGTSLFESLLVFENYPVDASAFQNMPASVRLQDFRSTSNNSYPLTVRVLPGASLKLEMMVDLTRFQTSQIERWLQQFATVLRQMTDSQTTVGHLLNNLQVEQQQNQNQQMQTLETSSLSKLKRVRRKAVAPDNQEVSS
ncbi:Linear gramicidin synthase subunit D [Acaryochloris thomasi RCC1774]|uniref:Linear gramicidin synthase subunit D n=1 Tax=Acaryochloris thomasi RCC1774 TaxID=1764569 RepID=A0A2W1JW40_9CYAN|nr:non-ribosomal peptide synthetase [Acaryochloris thomasi]PZD72647.1 Linear gramicidin synthase subunit D [Acaryochloris thomasi RCC1774]